MALYNNNNSGIYYRQMIRDLKQGRNKEQCSIIDYFLAISGGCTGTQTITDNQFVNILNKRVKELNIENRSLNKLGIDIDECQEIKPVTFGGYNFAASNSLVKKCNDGKWRASGYQITKIYFSDKQIYFYQYSFDLSNDVVSEITDEYFYKDVTNFSSGLDTVEKETWQSAGGCMGSVPKKIIDHVQYSSFRLVVPGDTKVCSMSTSNEIEDSIKGMKSKLREKKDE